MPRYELDGETWEIVQRQTDHAQVRVAGSREPIGYDEDHHDEVQE